MKKHLGIWKKLLFSLLFTIFLVSLALIVTEIWLRTTTCLGAAPTAFPNIPDQTVGWIGQPGLEVVRSLPTSCTTFRYNNLGFRGPDRFSNKPEGTFRVLVLGDSFVEGYQLPDDQLMTAHLERILAEYLNRPVQVINMGISGWGPAQEVLAYMRYGRAMKADIVIMMFASCNDIINSSEALSKLYNEQMEAFKPFFNIENDELVLKPPDRKLIDIGRALAEVQARKMKPEFWETMLGFRRLICRLRLGYLLWTRWEQPSQLRMMLDRWKLVPFDQRLSNTTWGEHGFHRGLSLRFWIYNPMSDPLWQYAVQVSTRTILHLNDLVKEDGGRMLLVSGANIEQIDQDIWELTQRLQPTIRQFHLELFLPEKRLYYMAQRQGINYFSLIPAFRQATEEGQELFLRGDGHWNEDGHLIAAQAIADFLRDTNYLVNGKAVQQTAPTTQ